MPRATQQLLLKPSAWLCALCLTPGEPGLSEQEEEQQPQGIRQPGHSRVRTELSDKKQSNGPHLDRALSTPTHELLGPEAGQQGRRHSVQH